jgi:exo-beta-1,3-glucanase (GH17 family)
MRLFLSTLLPFLPLTTAYWKGFNLGANLPTGPCKSQADWTKDFNVLLSLPGSFTSARLYASSDCNTLANAVPAALATGTKLLVGVWTEDGNHFAAEKAALQAAIQQHGHEWIVAVSVGSEDLYRKETSASTLAGQIYDVRGMLGALGAGGVQVGHVDTWTAWVDGANAAVIQACDFVGTDGYPYWQGAAVADGYNVFWESVQRVRDVVNTVKPGTWVWITETGWPVAGSNFGNSVPSRDNAQMFWKSVACAAFAQAHTFWYSLQDYTSSPSFGVVDANFNPLYSLAC